MTNQIIHIGILNYPGVMKSALYGFEDIFVLANHLSAENTGPVSFKISHYGLRDVARVMSGRRGGQGTDKLNIIVIPPCLTDEYYLEPSAAIKTWLLNHHAAGAILCSACAGAFILADTGLLNHRPATTHWALSDEFKQYFPDVGLDAGKILINDGDIITAAGLMSWVDLGLELVARFMTPAIMRQLGKKLIVDTGLREQRYYESFNPKLDHGDEAILKAQHFLQQCYHRSLTTADLSAASILAERTFLRRFVKATGLRPVQYLQKLRIQKACNLIESTNETIETISLKVGYEDTSSFRKVFLKIIGLTPREFRNRFVHDPTG